MTALKKLKVATVLPSSGSMKEEIQVGKGVCMANLFHFLLSCSKAALFPFLAIYFRQLGLSATQVGAVFCLKGLMWLWSAPLWTACAKWCNKKKAVLGMSLFFLAGSTLLLTLVPPTSPDLPKQFCARNQNNSRDNLPEWLHSIISNSNMSTTSEPPSTLPTTLSTSKQPESPGPGPVKISTTTTSTASTTTLPPTSTSAYLSNDDNEHDYSSYTSSSKADIDTNTGEEDDETKQIMQELKNLGLSEDIISEFLSMTEAQQTEFMKSLAEQLQEPKEETKPIHTSTRWSGTTHRRGKRGANVTLTAVDVNDTANDDNADATTLTRTLSNVMKTLGVKGQLPETFVFILVLVLIGEMFSSPVDKLADDVWFEYLDIIDSLDRYGSHRAWASLGLVVTAPLVTVIVDHLPCTLPKGFSSFMVHFFIFIGFMVFTFFAVCAYPVSTNRKTAKRSKLAKGVKVLCGDAHAVAYTLTMVIVGIAFTPSVYFLMWQMQDLEGSELVMGVAVAASAFSELLVYPLKGWLIQHISHAGAVGLALAMLAGRLAFYSVMWSPWLAVFGECTQGLTISLLWTTMQSYGDFRCNPYVMDRSAYSVINALYVIGSMLGAAVAGLVFDHFGFVILMRACAIVVAVWLFVFVITVSCVKRKEKVRYAALLQDDQDLSSDEDNTIYQDDWLEVALSKTKSR